MLMWAVAKVRLQRTDALRVTFRNFVEDLLSRPTPPKALVICLASWNVSTLFFKSDRLLDTAIEQLKVDESANVSDFASVLYACAVVGSDKIDLRTLEGLWEKLDVLGKADTLGLVLTGWSLAVIDCGRGQLKPLIQKIAKALSMMQLAKLTPSQRSMARVVVGAAGMDIELAKDPRTLKSSLEEKNWVSALAKAGIRGVQAEYEISPGVHLDLALPNRKIGFEVQGEYHYLMRLDTGERCGFSGPDKYKRMLVETAGWSLGELPAKGGEITHADVDLFLRPFLRAT